MLRGAENAAAARAVYPNGITITQAEQLLLLDLPERESAVLQLAKVPLTQGQFDAWSISRSTSALTPSPARPCSGGLTRRRAAEQALFEGS
jgi:GH24 family phage-related lysozyme (muramidase)